MLFRVTKYPSPGKSTKILFLRLSTVATIFFTSLSCHVQAAESKLNPAVKAYLDVALKTMRKNALHADGVNWVKLQAELEAELQTAESSVETYGSLRKALLALNDNHSSLQLPPVLQKAEMALRAKSAETIAGQADLNTPASSEWIYRRTPELTQLANSASPVAVLVVPAHPQQTGLDETANKIYQLSLQAQAAGTRHWIIDLRGNGGGNVFPMLAGLSGLLGDGKWVASIDARKQRTWFSTQRGAAYYVESNGKKEIGAKVLQNYQTLKKPVAVAVLIDRHTGSSGEIIALALKSFPNVRYFGEKTWGATTTTDGFFLPDGANLVLAFAQNTDKFGKVYPKGIEPDEASEFQPKILPPSQDPNVAQALNWLVQQK